MRNNLRKAREAWSRRQMATAIEAGLSVAEANRFASKAMLAGLVGVTTASLANWERGATTPRADKLMVLAGVLGRPVEELLADDGEVG